MLRRTFLLTCALLLTGYHCPGGDDPAPQLPPDGVWTKYDVILKQDDGREFRHTFKISLVGKEQFNGEACRWLETEANFEGQDKPEFGKLLVPEKELLQAARPFDHVKRFISKENDQVTVHLDELTLSRTSLYGPNFAFLPGVLKEAKTVATQRKIDYQDGQLSIENARQGVFLWERKFKAREGSESHRLDYTIWVHPDIPFGFAHARMKRTITFQFSENKVVRTAEIEVLLKDKGNDAKSAISGAL